MNEKSNPYITADEMRALIEIINELNTWDSVYAKDSNLSLTANIYDVNGEVVGVVQQDISNKYSFFPGHNSE